MLVLISPSGFQGKTYVITGPDSISAKDICNFLSKVTLNSVNFQEISQVNKLFLS